MRKTAAGLLIGVCAAASVTALTNLDALRTVELKTCDWRAARTADPSTARKDIALIEIDEYSLRDLQPNAGRWPWPRIVHATLIEYLRRGNPALIVYDVNFAEPDTHSFPMRLGAGGVFGEMSLLTGEARTATVRRQPIAT